MVLITVSMPVSEFTCFLTVPVTMMISCYLLLSDITAVFTGAVTKYIYIYSNIPAADVAIAVVCQGWYC